MFCIRPCGGMNWCIYVKSRSNKHWCLCHWRASLRRPTGYVRRWFFLLVYSVWLGVTLCINRSSPLPLVALSACRSGLVARQRGGSQSIIAKQNISWKQCALVKSACHSYIRRTMSLATRHVKLSCASWLYAKCKYYSGLFVFNTLQQPQEERLTVSSDCGLQQRPKRQCKTNLV